jgi:hypothetical protein
MKGAGEYTVQALAVLVLESLESAGSRASLLGMLLRNPLTIPLRGLSSGEFKKCIPIRLLGLPPVIDYLGITLLILDSILSFKPKEEERE